MMLSIRFSGWAQCRLATDPDPFDEPRGVSGYMRAYVGEPDLDRFIRFRDPPFTRTYTPAIGVSVASVLRDGIPVADHPLVGAALELVGAKFEGRNGAIAEDGEEPIVPFHLKIEADGETIERTTVPSDPNAPYREFNAKRADFSAGALAIVSRATGIPALEPVWRSRLATLRGDLAAASDAVRPALEERITFLERNLASRGGSQGFFGVLMEWDYLLQSPPVLSAGAQRVFGGTPPGSAPWRASFWFGGWDSDAQAFFVDGTLDIPLADASLPPVPQRRPERMSDIDPG